MNILLNNVVGIVMGLVLALVGVGVWGVAHVGQANANIVRFTDSVNYARADSRTANNGATLYVSSTPSTTTWTVYDGRPAFGQSLGPVEKTGTYPGSLTANGASQFAVFFSSAGEATEMAWSPISGQITSWPSCPASGDWSVTQTMGSQTSTIAFACQ